MRRYYATNAQKESSVHSPECYGLGVGLFFIYFFIFLRCLRLWMLGQREFTATGRAELPLGGRRGPRDDGRTAGRAGGVGARRNSSSYFVMPARPGRTPPFFPTDDAAGLRAFRRGLNFPHISLPHLTPDVFFF